MLKTNKKINVFLIVAMLFSMLSIYGFTPLVKAASLTDAKDTLSDSDLGPTTIATNTVTFTTGVALAADDYFEVTLADEFGDISTTTCPAGMSPSVTVTTARCTAAGVVAAGPQTIIIPQVANPNAAGYYTVLIQSMDDTGPTEIESADVKVYIIDDVSVSASVDSTLTFSITGVDAGTAVNGATTNATSTATSTPFGDLVPNATSTVAQTLAVGTNANDGFTVTVMQNVDGFRSPGGATINSFANAADGSASTTPEGWVDPLGEITNNATWGHWGLTSDDASLSGIDFSGSKFAGLLNSQPMQVMYHNGPSNGTIQGAGSTTVAYSVKITALQEAGDYTNTLTYVVTPQY